MSAQERQSPAKPSTISIKTTVMTAVIVVFGVLHVIGAVWLENAAASRSPDISSVLGRGD